MEEQSFSLSVAREGHCLSVIGNTGYVYDGLMRTLEVLDFGRLSSIARITLLNCQSASSWTKRSSQPLGVNAVQFGQAACIGPCLFIVGGIASNTKTPSSLILNTSRR